MAPSNFCILTGMKTILIIGAASAIAEETAKLYAARGYRLVLWGRNTDRLESIAKNLKVLGAQDVQSFEIDLDQCEKHAALFEKTLAKADAIDVALLAHGNLPSQEEVQASYEAMRPSLQTNFLSYTSLLTVLAGYFETRKQGVLAAITSVAADRGRKSLYVYGAAKAGTSAFVDGLRGRLVASGVHVINIKPGMVDTPMTSHLKKGVLFASPQRVAQGIVKAIRKKKSTAYIPGYWRLVMFLINCIPEVFFKRMNI